MTKATSLRKSGLLPSIELDFDSIHSQLEDQPPIAGVIRGQVRQVTGLLIKARLPNARIGELCTIEPQGRKPILAQVVGFDDQDVFLTALDPLDAIGPKTRVTTRGTSLSIPVGPELLGRVLDCLGRPIDRAGEIVCEQRYPVKRNAPGAFDRRRIGKLLPVGVRAIDTLFSIGQGQRVGVFSSAGVGKSSLLGMIARSSSADVNVLALVGERGREVLDFLEENLGEEGLQRSVVVVSTSNETPLRRITAAYTATAIAEYFRDQGKNVMLLMDSVTRFARALREIALSAGELPARQGYPPSVFATLPELLERAGNGRSGSITAFYTILLSGEQIEDPLGEEVRAILDGHLYLSSRLSKLQHFPAIDPLASVSRVMNNIAEEQHQLIAEKLRSLWAIYEENRDLISIGAYREGSNPLVDEAIEKREALVKFLTQRHDVGSCFEESLAQAADIADMQT